MVEVLRNRPILILAIAFIIGLSISEYRWNLVLTPCLGIILRETRSLGALVVGFLAGFALSPEIPDAGVERSRYLESPAKIISVPRLYPDRISYMIEVQGKRLTASEPASADRSFGDQLHVKGLVRPLREGTEDFQLAKGVVGRADLHSVQAIEDGPSWYRWAADLRRSFVAFTHRTLPPERAAVLDALCFNVEGGLSDEFESNLRSTGTIHIISASGLHVWILALAIDWLLGLLPFPRPLRLLILGLVLAMYAAAAGLQPAIIRSVLMSVVALSAYIWRRESDLLSALALSSIVYLLWEPLGIYNLGFQFSFLTVAAFALFGSVKESFPKNAISYLRENIKDNLRTTGIAYLATIPLLAFYFGSVSLVAIPSNLLIVPVVIALVIGGVASFGLSYLFPQLADMTVKFLLEPLIAYLEWIIDLFGNLIFTSVPGQFFAGYWLVPIYLICMMLWVKEHVRPA